LEPSCCWHAIVYYFCHYALPVSAPINLNLGTKVIFLTNATDDKTQLVLSPGISYFFPQSSVDLIADFNVSDAYTYTYTHSNSKTGAQAKATQTT